MSVTESDLDFSKLKVNELKLELKKRGLSTDGKKSELLERLQTSIGDSALLDDAHDDLLDDAELSDDVLDESAIETPPPPAEPTKSNPLKRPSNEEEKRHPKKIILNRKTIEALDAVTEPVEEQPAADSTAKPEVPAAREKVAIVEPKTAVVTQKERLEKRAARFNAPVSVRMAAYLATQTTNATLPTGSPISSAASIEQLKKRAERFGTIAPILEKVKVEEKKLIRLKRFGETDASLVNLNSVKPIDDKKAQRAARFASS